MDNLMGHSITVFLAFFAVMNPIANAAAFVGLTSGQDNASRKQTALKSIVTAFCIILFFCVLEKKYSSCSALPFQHFVLPAEC